MSRADATILQRIAPFSRAATLDLGHFSDAIFERQVKLREQRLSSVAGIGQLFFCSGLEFRNDQQFN